MRVVFTYLPIRLKEVTEIYLKYSIKNLNNQNIIPIIYSDKDYFKNTELKYDWIEFDIDEKYKHPLTESQTNSFIEIYKRYSGIPLEFKELNNTCIIATTDYENVNKTYSNVLNIIDLNYDFFIERYDDIPPITLNQQYLNVYFNNINYLYNGNPSYVYNGNPSFIPK